jgi:FtsH-binding integral membrane protein
MDLAVLGSILGIGLPVSQELQQHIEWIIIPVALQIVISFIVEKKFHEVRYAQILVTLAGAVAVTGYTGVFFLSSATKSAGDVIAAFIIFFILWTAFFHLVAWNYGCWLSTLALPRWASGLSLGNGVWVKFIEYIYLVFSSLGILRIVVGLNSADPNLRYVNVLAALLLGIGVAMRMTKTTIEIAKWDQPASSRN